MTPESMLGRIAFRRPVERIDHNQLLRLAPTPGDQRPLERFRLARADSPTVTINASRLLNVGDGTNSAPYSYVANSPLVSEIQFTNRTGPLRMTTTKQYDFLNRLTSISSVPSASSAVRVFLRQQYRKPAHPHRQRRQSRYWVYQYDSSAK